MSELNENEYTQMQHRLDCLKLAQSAETINAYGNLDFPCAKAVLDRADDYMEEFLTATAEQPQLTNHMTFSGALADLKEGQRIARHGWNGKDMWLEI